MTSGLGARDPLIVSAFHRALWHQCLFVLVIAAVVAVAWNVQRAAEMRRALRAAAGATAGVAGATAPEAGATAPEGGPIGEPPARRLLRAAFGLLWVLDGALQAQSAMPLGLAPTFEQSAAGSPSWARHLVGSGASIWSYHPVSAASAAVWIQVGLGALLMAAPRGQLSRLAGVASAGWGLIVWVFGEALGGIFAPGLTWLFGAPGAVTFYCVAGALVALPESSWAGGALGRAILRSLGGFFVLMSVLQAWPGRGFWQGRSAHRLGPIASMASQMARAPQPSVLSGWVSAFGHFGSAHGWAINLFVVIALAAAGLALLSGRRVAAVVGLAISVPLCLATWVLVQDFGFLGGLGTDPNSMVPLCVLLAAGYVAMARPAQAPAVLTNEAAGARGVYTGTASRRLMPLWGNPAYLFRTVAALGASGVVLLGAVPMTIAAASPHADPLLAEALSGGPNLVYGVAPNFHLVDEHGLPQSLDHFGGKAVVLTFLDDTCTSACPVIATELREADSYLGAAARHVQIVAVNANPRYLRPEYLLAFDRQEGLQNVPNWTYLTGTLPELRKVWASYGEAVYYLPGGAMVAHSDYVWVIDVSGHTREVISSDPGPASGASRSSFSVMLANAVQTVLRQDPPR